MIIVPSPKWIYSLSSRNRLLNGEAHNAATYFAPAAQILPAADRRDRPIHDVYIAAAGSNLGGNTCVHLQVCGGRGVHRPAISKRLWFALFIRSCRDVLPKVALGVGGHGFISAY
jgi:hypothetical protein